MSDLAPDARPAPVTILAVEDDEAIRRLYAAAFPAPDFRIVESETGEAGLAALAGKRPDIVLLDLGLPDISGIDFIRKARGWASTPIIVVSAAGDEERKVAALEVGADDYVTKPFSVAELCARIRVALRHSAAVGTASAESTFESGSLRVDFAARTVTKDGKSVHLSPFEYKLLAFLAKHAGKVVTHRQILQNVWGQEYSEEAQYLRVYMGYLRKKLEDDPASPRLLLTEPRIGYRLRA